MHRIKRQFINELPFLFSPAVEKIATMKNSNCHFICMRIGPITSLPPTSTPFCRTRTLPASRNTKASFRTSFMYVRQSLGLTSRATSDGQIVLSFPRREANNSIVSEIFKDKVKVNYPDYCLLQCWQKAQEM